MLRKMERDQKVSLTIPSATQRIEVAEVPSPEAPCYKDKHSC